MVLPNYDELPVDPSAPPGSSWGVWGRDDRLGCLNLLTPERVRRAIGCVRTGTVHALNLELELPDPPLFGRPAFEHAVSTRASGHDDELRGWNTQSSSQWDGFRHVRHPAHGFYGGLADESHGMQHWARRGLAGRAVLADVGRWRASVGRPLACDQSDPIEPSDLLATLSAQGTEVEMGDILLIRTGWVSWYRSLDTEGRTALARQPRMASCGLSPGEATARMLWNLHVAAVAADNPALELWPAGAFMDPDEATRLRQDPVRCLDVFVHFSLLPLLGLPIGELWDLDGLAADCAADGRYECLLTSAPLNLAEGVASPPNALALR
jgi:hypothetical protein